MWDVGVARVGSPRLGILLAGEGRALPRADLRVPLHSRSFAKPIISPADHFPHRSFPLPIIASILTRWRKDKVIIIPAPWLVSYKKSDWDEI